MLRRVPDEREMNKSICSKKIMLHCIVIGKLHMARYPGRLTNRRFPTDIRERVACA